MIDRFGAAEGEYAYGGSNGGCWILGGIIYETRALYGRAAVLEEVKTLDARGRATGEVAPDTHHTVGCTSSASSQCVKNKDSTV